MSESDHQIQGRRAGSPDDEPEDDEVTPKKSSKQILRHEIEEGDDALEWPASRLFVSGLSAGLDIGFSLFLMAIVWTIGAGQLSEPVLRLLIANMYAFGFVVVVLGRSELFTEQTTLAVLPVLGGHAKVRALLRLWSIVYVANLIGVAAFAALAVWIGDGLDVIRSGAFGHFAHKMVAHPPGMIFLSGVLAGWLMGLLSWLVAAARDTISQIAIVWLIASAIGLAGLHHVVLGTAEVLAGVFAGEGASIADFGRFLLFATLGNATGGPVFVALVKFGVAKVGSE